MNQLFLPKIKLIQAFLHYLLFEASQKYMIVIQPKFFLLSGSEYPSHSCTSKLEAEVSISFISDFVGTIKQRLLFTLQSLSHVQLFATPHTAACQASLSFTIFWSLLKLMSLNPQCHPTISSSKTPFSSCHQSSSLSGSFQMSKATDLYINLVTCRLFHQLHILMDCLGFYRR